MNEFNKDEKNYIKKLKFNLGGSHIEAKMIEIYDDNRPSIDVKDTLKIIRIGTVGTDFANEYITELDFKNRFIQLYQAREEWMSSKNNFVPFDFTRR